MCISSFSNCTVGAKDPSSSRRRLIQSFLISKKMPCLGGKTLVAECRTRHPPQFLRSPGGNRVGLPYFIREIIAWTVPNCQPTIWYKTRFVLLCIFYMREYPVKSRMTSPASSSPAAPGTKDTLPGICRLPSAAASSSQPEGFQASSRE